MYQIYNVYIICAYAAIGGGLFGFDISSMAGVIGTNAYSRFFDDPGSYQQGGIVAAMPAGSFFGALASSFIADKYSRKTTIQIGALIWIFGSIIQTASNGVPMLVVGRIISGLCVGIASTIVPVYQAEIAPKEIRGRVVSLQQWAITWGILVQYFIQYGASFIDGGKENGNQSTAAFRIPWGIQMIPAAFLFVGMFFFPKSPRWLGSQDRWEEAIKVLAKLHGGGDINHPKVLAEYQEIEEALSLERLAAKTDWYVITEKRMRGRVILGMSIQMWSQLTGINTMMYYVFYVMAAAQIADPLLTASIQYILNMILTLPAILYLDKWGRRPLLLYGAFIMMILLFSLGSLQAVYGRPFYIDHGPLASVSWELDGTAHVSGAFVALSYLFVSAYAVTWGPTSWTYTSEIFPIQIRTRAVSLATASNWAWNTALAFAVPPLLWNINWRLYMVFGMFNGLACIHMYLAAPETKGKTLEEMNDVFESGRPAWKSVPKGSRLDRIAKEIEDGQLKVSAPLSVFDEKIQTPAAIAKV